MPHIRPRLRRLTGRELLEPRTLLAADLVGHWVAEDLVSTVEDGEAISVWTDRVAGIDALAVGLPRLAHTALDDNATVRYRRQDGADSFVVAAADSPMSGAEDYSIAIGFATASTALNGGTAAWFLNTGLVDGTDFFGTTADWGVVINGSGQIGAGLGKPATSVYSSVADLNDGLFHLAVVTRRADTLTIYVDGAEVGTRSGAGTEPRLPLEMTFGAVSRDTFAYSGDIAEIRIFNDDLTPAEVTSLFTELNTTYTHVPPAANDDSYLVTEDVELVVDIEQGVLANDINLEPNPNVAQLVQTTSHGDLIFNEDGSFQYLPDADYVGPDSFQYLTNNTADSNIATVTLDVESVYDPPVAFNDAYLVATESLFITTASNGVQANDRNADGVTITSTLIDDAQHGTLTLRSDGSFDYTSEPGFVGTDQFSYQSTDGITPTEVVTVRIIVGGEPVIISELHAAGGGSFRTRTRTSADAEFSGSTKDYDWIELQNITSLPLDLAGRYLTDDPDDLRKWQLPLGSVIPAQGTLVVYASGENLLDPMLDERGIHHTNFRLAREGGYLGLANTDGTLIDEISPAYPPQVAGVSYGVSVFAADPQFFQPPTPGAINENGQTAVLDPVTISDDSGFLQAPIAVTIRGATPEATVRYTLDGSEPSEDQGLLYQGPITVDRTTVLRARAFASDRVTSQITTRTYLFLQDVPLQTEEQAVAEGWPTSFGANSRNLGMDPDIVDDPVWGPQLHDALTQIPSLSVVTEFDNLFDSETGIYANPGGRGKEWERPAALALLHPDGSTGFEVNMGIRIRGGFSRSTGNPKHALRFFFRDEYGNEKLRYPLFGDEGTAEFDSIDLRTAQNYSWAFQNNSNNTFVRDLFSRIVQGEMGQPHTRGEFYHLYINGHYWGIFQTDERPEASYAASYFGGDPDDYDTIKIRRESTLEIEASDGNTDAYFRLWEATKQGFEENSDYYRVQGFEPDGITRNPSFERLLDVDNLIDYMIITYYTGDRDGPGSRFTLPRPNNMFATFNRENPDGFKWYEHDSEHSLGTGENDMINPFVIERGDFENTIENCPSDRCDHPGGFFSAHWLHEVLMDNEEYRVRFADRVHQHLFGDGPLTTAASLAIIDRIASDIDLAIIAESARWGNRNLTKETWETAVESVRSWVTGREDVLLDQLRSINEREGRPAWNWFPRVDAPTLSHTGGALPRGTEVTIDSTVGPLYYTLDGSDPRLIGGGVSPVAVRAEPGDTLTIDANATLNVRSFSANEWSALESVAFDVGDTEPLPLLRISEIHYHAADLQPDERAAGFTDPNDFEFLELVNIGTTSVNLDDVQLAQVEVNGDVNGVAFDFATGSVDSLTPGARLVVVEDLPAFNFRYGNQALVAGEWSGGLSNGSERLTLLAAGQVVQQFTYDDDWHPSTDGDGPSLQIVDATNPDLSIWGQAGAWVPSPIPDGTPGAASIPGDVDTNLVVDADDIDALYAEIRSGGSRSTYDVTHDGMVDQNDVDELVLNILQTVFGDTNLDGTVTVGEDGQSLLASLGQGLDLGWRDGDFNGDRRVTASEDGALLLASLTADRAASSQPTDEPPAARPGELAWEAVFSLPDSLLRRSSWD